MSSRGRRLTAGGVVALLIIGAVVSLALPSAQGRAAGPGYRVDPFWPKPLPTVTDGDGLAHQWVTGMVGASCIDSHDHIITVNRGFLPDGLLPQEGSHRGQNRIQVFDREGSLRRIITVDPPEYMRATLRATDIDLSRDAEQRHLLVVDLGSNRIWILERESGDIVGSVGGSGHMAGEFTFPHTIVTDSDSSIYAAETLGGRRNQKFVRTSD